MRSNSNNKYMIVYVILGILLVGAAYTACKDITPETQRMEEDITLKLDK